MDIDMGHLPDKLPGESNTDFCKRAAASIPPELLVTALLRHIHKRICSRRHSNPLWSFVGDATAHGSGIASAIVAQYFPEGDQ